MALKPRLIVTTDIGGDPDDQQSLVRLLLYSNEIDIEGLIASSTADFKTVRSHLIWERVHAYGLVRKNLLLHKADYPAPEKLFEGIKCGYGVVKTFCKGDVPQNPWEGKDPFFSIGEGKDTEASEWIIEVVDRPDPRPVWISIWGGPNELAQAIWKISKTRSRSELDAFKKKIRVHANGDQDNTGFWLEKEHPDIFWVRCGCENWQKPFENQALRGMYQLGDESLMSKDWLETNIYGHGPLGMLYPSETWSPPNNCMKEGDTPDWMHLIDNGLCPPEHPEWGSWGGRYEKTGSRYGDAADTLWGITNERVCVARWRQAFQADFAARMDWCIKPFSEANHEPLPVVKGDLERKARPGEKIILDASESRDPDGDSLNYNWYFYTEPGSFKGEIRIEKTDAAITSFTTPKIDSPVTIHIILTVTDNGNPPLSRYKRVVVTVEP